MTTSKGRQFVLLLDRSDQPLPRAAFELAGDDGALLIARTIEAAVELAQQYKPTHALIPRSLSQHVGKFVPDLLREFSPAIEVRILEDGDRASQATASSL